MPMQGIEKRVRAVLGKLLKIEEAEISADAARDSYAQWDSLMHMNLMLSLEDEFSIEFTDDEIAGIASLSALIKSIEEKCI